MTSRSTDKLSEFVLVPREPNAAFCFKLALKLNPASPDEFAKAIAFDFLGYHRALVAACEESDGSS